MVIIRWIEHGTPDYEAVVALRRTVLRIPLGLDFTPDDLKRESGDAFLSVWNEGLCVGCLVMTRLSDHTVKMRQVAVVESLQGQGIGQQMVQECERWSLEMGFKQIVLNARETAVRFYLKLGYQLAAESFIEVGIPHRQMTKEMILLP